jgi:aspartate racemase
VKTIGIIGGMSWESTAVYYRRINELVRERLGGLHSARVIVNSVDFAPIAAMQAAGDWEKAGIQLGFAAHALQQAGAHFIVLATNTMHKVARHITGATGLPMLHIGDVTADALLAAGKTRPLLLATRFTMEQAFYRDHLKKRGIEAIVPDQGGRDAVHGIIYDELCKGIVRPESKARYLAVIEAARSEKIDSVIFGCTEIGMLLSLQDVPEGAFDTTELHCVAAVDAALA